MRIISSNNIAAATTESQKLYVYNGLDSAITLEILHEIKPQLNNNTAATYRFRRDLLAPILEMNMSGILVDRSIRDNLIREYSRELIAIEKIFSRVVYESFGVFLNWKSTKDLLRLFYDILKIPPVKKRNAKGQMAPTVNRDALEKIKSYFIAKFFVNIILAMRGLGKKISVLETSIAPDGRMKTSYNIAGTTTGRLSSSMSDLESGGNLQNIEERLRRQFIAEPGRKFAYIDLEQAESRACGGIHWNLFKDPRYLDACESGDLHTSVCRLAWKNLPWTSDMKQNKIIAEQPFYRQHSYRHMAKVLGHGSNYEGKPTTMAQHTKLEVGVIAEFQKSYFSAFPAFPLWHRWVANEIRQNGKLVSLLGMERIFLDRPDDPATVRAAVAFDPQSSIGELLNRGMLAVWKLGICTIVLQIHDAILISYPEDREDEIVPKAVAALQIPIKLLHGRDLIIPSEAKVGWNWANFNYKNPEENPDGLKVYKGHDDRRRTSFPKV